MNGFETLFFLLFNKYTFCIHKLYRALSDSVKRAFAAAGRKLPGNAILTLFAYLSSILNNFCYLSVLAMEVS